MACLIAHPRISKRHPELSETGEHLRVNAPICQNVPMNMLPWASTAKAGFLRRSQCGAHRATGSYTMLLLLRLTNRSANSE